MTNGQMVGFCFNKMLLLAKVGGFAGEKNYSHCPVSVSQFFARKEGAISGMKCTYQYLKSSPDSEFLMSNSIISQQPYVI